MINFNGSFVSESKEVLLSTNRGFKFGDALFETLRVENLNPRFMEDHYFRLMASMRMLRMEIPMSFTMEFLKTAILKTVEANNLENARVRLTVFRENGGLYSPSTNKIGYLIEATPLTYNVKKDYSIDIFRDYYVYSGILSSIKTTNKITNVLAGIYASENNIDNCILVNEKKLVVEAINGNIFVVTGNTIKTPAITEGCVKGIVRKKIIEIVSKMVDYELLETSISPFDLQKADEVFITNAIIGVQPITNYKKSNFSVTVSEKIAKELTKLV